MTYAAHHKRMNFPKDVRRQARERSKGLCECIGPDYGLKPGQRCNAPLDQGIHFEHIIADSIGGKPVLANCLAACPRCNLFKADKIDKPRAAKTKRQSDKHHGIRKPKGTIKSRGFVKRTEPPPQRPIISRLKPGGIKGEKFAIKRKGV